MNAIVITPAQRTALLAANVGHHITLEPRQLQDGRLILNADILADPYFIDPSRPWAVILGISAPEEIPADQSGDLGAPQVGDVQLPTQNSPLPIVDLTEADLAEPAQ